MKRTLRKLGSYECLGMDLTIQRIGETGPNGETKDTFELFGSLEVQQASFDTLEAAQKEFLRSIQAHLQTTGAERNEWIKRMLMRRLEKHFGETMDQADAIDCVSEMMEDILLALS